MLVSDSVEIVSSVTDIMMAIAGIFAIASTASSSRKFIHKHPKQSRALLWQVTFGMFVVASLLAAANHGLALPQDTLDLIWTITFFLLGTMVGLFAVCLCYDLINPRAALYVLPIAMLVGIGFFTTSLIQGQDYSLFIMYQTSVLLIALLGYLYLAIKHFNGGWWIVTGISCTILASAVQATELISFVPHIPLDHNGVYHLIQTAAVIMMARGVAISFQQNTETTS